MTFYKGWSAADELTDICERMDSCESEEVLCTVRLSTIREAAQAMRPNHTREVPENIILPEDC